MSVQVSIILDTRRIKKEKTYPVKLRVYSGGKAFFYATIYDLTEDEFKKLDAKRVSDTFMEIREKLKELVRSAAAYAEKISPFDFEKFEFGFVRDNPMFREKNKRARDDSKQTKTAGEIPEEWERKYSIFKEPRPAPDSISLIYLQIIRSLLSQARIGTAGSYQSSYNSLKAFKGNLRFKHITPQLLKEYESWMIHVSHNSKTTVGIYMRALRAVFNEAISQKLSTAEEYPFGRRKYGIPTGRNIKKAITTDSIAKLYYTEIEKQSQEKARAYWFFSFYGNGMNVKDIINLKFKNIKGEFLVFERAKTELTTRGGEPIIISCFITEDMWRIINQWGNKDRNPENYIFPVLLPGLTPIRQFEIKQNFTRFINKNMAKVSVKAEIGKKVKTMECRHSASTIMKNSGLPAHYIKESLGHASLRTTENYLGGFEDSQKKEFSKILDGFKTA